DSESYKAFGFDGKDIYNHNSMYKTSTLREWSQEELSKLNSEEVKSLQFFTSNEYEWFNDVVYDIYIIIYINIINIIHTLINIYYKILINIENVIKRNCKS